VSSTEFAVELTADPRCRHVVFASGLLLAVIGTILLAATPLDPLARIFLLVIWLGDCGWTLRRLHQGWHMLDRVRLSTSGAVQVRYGDRPPVAVALLTGTVVTRRVAWLRFARTGGPPRAELFLASGSERLVWQRFQLIWRLCRDSIGHRGVA
jgi:hypothetical protein